MGLWGKHVTCGEPMLRFSHDYEINKPSTLAVRQYGGYFIYLTPLSRHYSDWYEFR